MRIDANRRARQPRPKLGPLLATLGSWLEVEATLPTRARRTTQRLHDALCLEGAVDAVRRHIRAFECRRHPSTTAFIPQIFPLSEAYQFEWNHDHVELGGIEQVVKVAHVRLCHSRAFFLAAYPRQSQEIVFDSHAWAFAIVVGRARRYNRRFPGDVRPLPDRADGVHARVELGEGSGREPGWQFARVATTVW